MKKILSGKRSAAAVLGFVLSLVLSLGLFEPEVSVYADELDAAVAADSLSITASADDFDITETTNIAEITDGTEKADTDDAAYANDSSKVSEDEEYSNHADATDAADWEENDEVEDMDSISEEASILYTTHVQNIGWQSYVKNDAMAGTNGRSLRLETIQIRLTGEIAEKYDIYYRVHVQDYGWLSWAANGDSAGTAGLAKRLEGIQIKLVEKNAADMERPESGIAYFGKPTLTYRTHVQNYGWQDYVSAGSTSGTSGKSLRLEGININLQNAGIDGGIEYRTHIQNIGWESEWKSANEMSGTSGRALRLEAIQIRLTGELANYFKVYYRVHCQNIGWMGWASDGQSAGSQGFAYRLEGIQIKLAAKGEGAPGSTASSFVKMDDLCISLNSASTSRAITTFGGYNMSGNVRNQLQSALNSLGGYDCGFMMIDIETGMGISYNADQIFFSASTIKAPFVASLAAYRPDLIKSNQEQIHKVLSESSNWDYDDLANRYGTSMMQKWAMEAGTSLSFRSVYDGIVSNYSFISTRTLAKLWVRNYRFFTSGESGSYIRDWYKKPSISAIKKTLGSKYTTQSKAGYNDLTANAYDSTADAGVVYAGDHPYIIAVMTNIPEQMDRLNGLVSSIDQAHSELVKG